MSQNRQKLSLWPLKIDDVLGDVMHIKPEPKAKKHKPKARRAAIRKKAAKRKAA